MTQKVLIVGLGLIGASLAIGIKKSHPNLTLVGWDFAEKTRDIAIEQQMVDEVALDFKQGAQTANWIVLAVPARVCLQYLNELATLSLQSNVLVTDVSSTKEEIMSVAEKLPFDFIGGHPMAGSHKSGILAGDGNLFENAYYIFTPPHDQTVAKRVDELKELFKGSRAKYVELSANEHDQITGMLSHLPHIIAAGLVNQADQFNQMHPRSKQLAAGGFRDITRIASSDPQMWTDILLSNRRTLIKLLQKWQGKMTEVADWLSQENAEAIYRFFEQAKDTRDKLPIHRKGAIPAFYDLFVDVPDTPGVIAKVTTLLGEEEISLTNLRILETREDIIGVLQITFKNQQDLMTGKALIESKTNYQCRLK